MSRKNNGGLDRAAWEETGIWQKYAAGKDQHHLEGMYEQVARCHRFYEGDQWHGLKAGGEELPSLNFIKPICRYQIATVAMNEMAVVFSSLSGKAEHQALCDSLTRYAAAQIEKSKLDSKKWAIVKNACIAGDHYLYVFDERQPTASVAEDLTPRLKHRLIDKDDLYLANEQEPELAAQPWIILAERVPVEQARRMAGKNGLSAEEIERIVADEELDTGDGSDREVKTGRGKCTSLLYMEKTEAGIQFCRSTRAVVYQPLQTLKGLDVYPVCGMRWEEKHGSARGVGVVERLIPNQIEVNKTLARRSLVVKRYGYPTAVIDGRKVQNPRDLATVGATIKVENLGANPIASAIQYLNPAPMSGDAANLEAELLTQSRELEGAGEAATGQVDPAKASGEAIKAARDQSALNLNEQMANFKQFMEDLAQIWYKLWVAYSTGGMRVKYTDESGAPVDQVLPHEQLRGAELDIRIDISPADPYSVLSRELALENALGAGHINFEEYVEALDANSGVPKEKLKAILDRRKAQGGPEGPGMEGPVGAGGLPVPGMEGLAGAGGPVQMGGAAGPTAGGLAGLPGPVPQTAGDGLAQLLAAGQGGGQMAGGQAFGGALPGGMPEAGLDPELLALLAQLQRKGGEQDVMPQMQL